MFSKQRGLVRREPDGEGHDIPEFIQTNKSPPDYDQSNKLKKGQLGNLPTLSPLLQSKYISHKDSQDGCKSYKAEFVILFVSMAKSVCNISIGSKYLKEHTALALELHF